MGFCGTVRGEKSTISSPLFGYLSSFICLPWALCGKILGPISVCFLFLFFLFPSPGILYVNQSFFDYTHTEMMFFLLSTCSDENPTPNVEREHSGVPKRRNANRELLLIAISQRPPLLCQGLRVCWISSSSRFKHFLRYFCWTWD